MTGRSPARRAEVGGLALVQPRRRQEGGAGVAEQPHIHFADLRIALNFNPTLARGGEGLGDVIALKDVRPDASCDLSPR